MKCLYYNFVLQGKGVFEVDYWELFVSFGGDEINQFLDDYCYGIKLFESILMDVFEFLGMELFYKLVVFYGVFKCGIKVIYMDNKVVVFVIYLGSIVDMGGLQIGDMVLVVNGNQVNNDLDKWLQYFDDEIKVFMV